MSVNYAIISYIITSEQFLFGFFFAICKVFSKLWQTSDADSSFLYSATPKLTVHLKVFPSILEYKIFNIS